MVQLDEENVSHASDLNELSNDLFQMLSHLREHQIMNLLRMSMAMPVAILGLSGKGIQIQVTQVIRAQSQMIQTQMTAQVAHQTKTLAIMVSSHDKKVMQYKGGHK